MHIGELVWIRNGPEDPTWGIIIEELTLYLTDHTVMVSYEVLANAAVYHVDKSDLLRFHYYNRHLYDKMETKHW